eukprot:2193274-Rhodomonas_salina.2
MPLVKSNKGASDRNTFLPGRAGLPAKGTFHTPSDEPEYPGINTNSNLNAVYKCNGSDYCYYPGTGTFLQVVVPLGFAKEASSSSMFHGRVQGSHGAGIFEFIVVSESRRGPQVVGDCATKNSICTSESTHGTEAAASITGTQRACSVTHCSHDPTSELPADTRVRWGAIPGLRMQLSRALESRPPKHASHSVPQRSHGRVTVTAWCEHVPRQYKLQTRASSVHCDFRVTSRDRPSHRD